MKFSQFAAGFMASVLPAAVATLLFTSEAGAATITIPAFGNLPVILTVVESDYAGLPDPYLFPAPGMFEDVILMVRSSFGPPPLAFGELFVFQTDALNLPSNIWAYAVNVPRMPAEYRLSIGNTSGTPYSLDPGPKLTPNPEPGSWLLLLTGSLLGGYILNRRNRPPREIQHT